MTDWQRQENAAKAIRAEFSAGDKIKLIDIKDDVYCQYNGEIATIRSIDALGQLHCVTDSGHSCTVCRYYGDTFAKV